MATEKPAGNSPATTNQTPKDQAKAQALQKLEGQMNAAPNLRTALMLPSWEQRYVANYEAVTGRKDGKIKFMDDVITLTEMAMDNPKISECTRVSMALALTRVASTGLSLKAPGHVYMVPTGKHLKMQVGGHGKKQMLRLMPTVKFVHEGEIVAMGDDFAYDKLNKKILLHATTSKSVQITKAEDVYASYCRIEFKDGRIIDVIVFQADLLKARSASKNKTEGNVWQTWPGEMCKKVSYHRAFKAYWEPSEKQIDIADIKNDETETLDASHTVVSTHDTDFMPAPAEVVETKGGDTVDTSSGEVLNEKKEEEKKEQPKKDFFDN